VARGKGRALKTHIATGPHNVAPRRLGRHSEAKPGSAEMVPAAKPVHATPLHLDPGLSGEAVLLRAGRACLDHMRDNEEAALSGDIEGIHQMRVAVRRLRAILSAFAPLLPKEPRRWASNELRWFVDILGKARNLDVFDASLLQPARAALPDTAGFERLAMATGKSRKAAHETVVEVIGSTRYKASVLAMLRWFKDRRWRACGDLDDLQRPIGELAPVLLDRCRRQVKKHSKHFARQSATQRHRLRIALKKWRYAAELLESLYDRAATERFTERLRRLQDGLGEINDVRVGRHIIAAQAARDAHATRIGDAGNRVLAWHKHRLAEDEPRWRHDLHHLLKDKPFWSS